MDSFGQMVSILITVLFLFFAPVFYMAQKQEMVVQTYVFTETTLFLDNIRTSGRLTKNMYLTFMRKLEETNILYDIKIEHLHKVFTPVYDDDNKEFKNDYSIHYYTVFEDDILKEVLEGKGVYYMSEGDSIRVDIQNRTETLASKLKYFFHGEMDSSPKIIVTYGGVIRNEDY